MGKGKVHPSPSPPAAGGCWGEMTVEAVLMRLLPAAVLAAAAPLGAEGKEVLAYLVLASLRSSAPATPTRARGDGKADHRPELGCGCFGCYTAYWSRWDGSPEGDREAIHCAIEAFDEHLAEEERERGGGGRRGRKKRAAAAAAAAAGANEAAKQKSSRRKGKGKEVFVDPIPPLHPPADLPAPEEAPKAEDGAGYLTAEDEKEDASASTAAGGSECGEEEKRRRGWGSVLSWKAWGLWGTH